MNLTPEKAAQGRRNFLKILAGTPALAALGATAALQGPVRGGPVRVGFVGVGGQGRLLLSNVDPAFAEVRALCDINPSSLTRADQVLTRNQVPPARHYAECSEMLQQEDIEAVIMAPPLWAHADLASLCLDAGKHVLCEKMMAWDIAGCERMREAARRSGKVLEIGYQRNYNAMYQAAYDGIVKSGALGDIFHVRLAWHRNGNWRRKGEPPSPDYDPAKWGYPTFEHLINWRLYWKYSQGLIAELCSHQLNATNWFLGSTPEAVSATGGVYRFKDGREVFDHLYATFEYPHGQTAVFSSIESNAFDDYYEMFLGTKGTLILRRETEALFFEEGGGESGPTSITVAPQSGGPAAVSSETQAGNTNQATAQGSAVTPLFERPRATRLQIQRFCSAIRVGTPLACGPDKAFDSARSCIRANEAATEKTRLAV
ncbi:MAG TPA: Gfo/Idh/MocA family oxidoreductase [Bradyrhizobium sp.]|nr:Gfo/Idh/MocA family oxidoreductase [Bradyrhizobium sp.]